MTSVCNAPAALIILAKTNYQVGKFSFIVGNEYVISGEASALGQQQLSKQPPSQGHSFQNLVSKSTRDPQRRYNDAHP